MILYDIHNFPFRFIDSEFPLLSDDGDTYLTYYMMDETKPMELELRDSSSGIVLELNQHGKLYHIFYTKIITNRILNDLR